MIITKLEFLACARIDASTLQVRIEEEWLIPARSAPEPVFSETDLARAKPIHDLTDDIGVSAEGVGVVLGLLDQVHGLRRAMTEDLNEVRVRNEHSGEQAAGTSRNQVEGRP
jgi:chaperone modulatory protein CbpM